MVVNVAVLEAMVVVMVMVVVVTVIVMKVKAIIPVCYIVILICQTSVHHRPPDCCPLSTVKLLDLEPLSYLSIFSCVSLPVTLHR